MDRHVDFQNPSEELTLPSLQPDAADNHPTNNSHFSEVNPGTVAVLATAGITLAACGGGGGGGSSSSGGSSGGGGTTIPVIPLSNVEAARFLQQAQFSSTETEITAAMPLGIIGWLNKEYSTSVGQTGWDWLNSKGHNAIASDAHYFDSYQGDFMVWNQLLTGNNQFRKRVSLALSEMFVMSLNSLDGFWPSYKAAGYWDMLMANAFGNFRTLLEAVTLNPAIGQFLNTRGNLKEDGNGREPDENYAREVMQLMTIGLYQLNTDGSHKTDSSGNPVETYTQSDISNLARVFTGYDDDMSGVTQTTVSWVSYTIPTPEFCKTPMTVTESNHSTLAATFLGTTIPAGTGAKAALKTALDALFNHANVGPFFARQMIQRLVTSNPSSAYIGRVAAKFNNNGSGVRGDLKAVWTAIFTDTESTTVPTAATAGRLREPIARFVQLCRTIGVTDTSDNWTLYSWDFVGPTQLGQSPLRSPSVFNFYRPGYVPPNTALATAGLVAPEFQIVNETTVAGYLNFLMGFLRYGYYDLTMDFSQIQPTVSDSATLLANLNLHFCANQLSATTIATIKAALDPAQYEVDHQDAYKYDRTLSAIFLVMASPEYLIQK
jgi:uncharacterized protein (DUF1800 family)